MILGIAGVFLARYHRERVSSEFSDVITREQRTPADVTKIKKDLAEMDLTRDALQRELEDRMKFVGSLESENFYLSIDTNARKLRFYYGDTILREADIIIGKAETLSASDKSWTFVPLKGAFPIEAKLVDHAWPIPEWVYAMNGQPVPAERAVVTGGLGKYVLFLPNGYAIHTEPPPESPLQGAKPGSYMTAENFMRAVWPRISAGQTQVYIF
ncbi:MAG: hypothetical protein M3P06_22200 [Acidobacteriota bacterium]|nr:hypothetical protein [Acidobacteriota bacterium]